MSLYDSAIVQIVHFYTKKSQTTTRTAEADSVTIMHLPTAIQSKYFCLIKQHIPLNHMKQND